MNSELDPITEARIKAFTQYQLTREQVENPKFGSHTLEAIDFLTTYDKAEDNQEAFGMVQDLDATQVEGLRFYNLGLDQVQTPNFGKHTLEAMNYLIFMEDMGENNPEVFEKVSGLNEIQTKGVIEYELTKDQVTSPNFGTHTLEGIDTLISNDLADNFQEAFFQIVGMTKEHTEQYLTKDNAFPDKDPKINQEEQLSDTLEKLQKLTKASSLEALTNPFRGMRKSASMPIFEESYSGDRKIKPKPTSSKAARERSKDARTPAKKNNPKP
ncbi:hypothetical protein [Ascidiimonas sp. W6]|uniref:hypothetical protein n=1 Tax=Ascidiimonas meishanensis TaxID=3128903 RepID=UPI0030EC2C65